MQHIKFFILPTIVFFTITGTGIVLSRADYSWSQWRPASCLPDHCFCEAIRNGAVAQPANTYSSFGFVLIGLLVLGNAQKDIAQKSQQTASNPMTRNLAYAAVYGVALVLIGVGSAFYHASLTFVGQFCDVMGMYLLASFILLYNLSRQSLTGRREFVLSYVLLNLILGYLLVEAPQLRRYLFGTLIIAALVIETRVRQQKSRSENPTFLRTAVVALLSAFFIWALDITKVWCTPDSWLQGHAIWHLLSALAGGFLYLYYRSKSAAAANSLASQRWRRPRGRIAE